MTPKFEIREVEGEEIRITNPDKVFFPDIGVTKLDLVDYYLTVADGVLIGCRDRPTTLYRWPNGVQAPDDAFYQKRVPQHRPEWTRTALITFPSGRTATFLTIVDAPHLAWAINLGCIDLNPWPVRSNDVDHPDELRVDLDPTPGIDYADVRLVALEARKVLEEHGLTGFPKTSGKRGMHIFVPIEPRWTFTQVRRAALAFAREIERRMPETATTAWWKEERRGVFVDYNQNARDRTIASAYCVRPVPDARVSCPLFWDEVADVEPADLTIKTVPERYLSASDPLEGYEEAAASLDSLHRLADEDEASGQSDAPWPPMFPKGEKEPTRVQPSRARPPT